MHFNMILVTISFLSSPDRHFIQQKQVAEGSATIDFLRNIQHPEDNSQIFGREVLRQEGMHDFIILCVMVLFHFV